MKSGWEFVNMDRIIINIKNKQKLNIGLYEENERKLEILQSLGGLYDGLAFYPLHWF